MVAIYKGEAGADTWLEFLRSQSEWGTLILCEVAVAEVAELIYEDAECIAFLQVFKIEYDSVQTETALLAGNIFSAYRRGGGTREQLISDFLIGAHALLQADQLAAADRGYLRRYFPKLRVIGPGRPKRH